MRNPVTAFSHKNFRWHWLGQLLSSNGHWMDNLVRGWLVFELTGSAAQLGLVSAAKSIPLLAVGLFAGVLVDRFDRRLLLTWSQCAIALLHAALAVVLLVDAVALWHLYASSVLVGVARAVQGPSRQALLAGTVPVAKLHNAVTLSAGTGTLGQSVGPAVGGVLLAALGYGPTFACQALLALAAGMAAFQLRVPAPREAEDAGGLLRPILAGFAYVRRNTIVLSLLLLALAPMFLGMPFQELIPVMADEVLRIGPRETGLLLGMTGVGSGSALLVLMWIPTIRRPGLVLLAAVALFSCAIVAFGLSSSLVVALVAVGFTGVARGVYRTLNQTLILTHTDPRYLGRVNSIYVLDRGVMPLGVVTIGFLAEAIGIAAAITSAGALCLLLIVGGGSLSRSLRAL